MKEPLKGVTRRDFLQVLGSVAGSGSVYAAMSGLGLAAAPAAASNLPAVGDSIGKGVRVGIIGAGISGLAAAYELRKRGYECTVIEANGRAGGRSLTLRGGDAVVETGGIQHARWDRETQLYANMGPARIPYHHKTVLNYCREFGVPLEVFVNENRAAFVHDSHAFAGKPQENRYIVHSTRGMVAELLAKAVNRKALDDVLTAEDVEKLLTLLKGYGELDKDYIYRGGGRAGYAVTPGAGAVAGTQHQRPALADLLRSEFVRSNINFTEEWNQAATMLQPVGGMDKIVQGFLRQVGDLVIYNAPVQEIRKTGERARIVYKHDGQSRVLDVDFAIITIPIPALARIDTDFSATHREAMQSCRYTQAAKIAFQADRRFWEEDARIYGGISWTDQGIGQIWYPSGGLMEKKGILVGAYIRDDSVGASYARMSYAERIESALADGEKIHPGYRQLVKNGVAVCWPNMPYAQGGWAVWTAAARKNHYPTLTRPDGPLYLAGDQVSHVPG
ncbi:flavin monoamine oxidase family protein [Noviherbaspirillum sp.]|uniref:flavin monoamine oxidase family protein n=1 Tax=Noviherbaspirillum sp. TaxID=1926288 RepID=UPI002D36A7EC|nr:flavin monoamine oxidase family protein [Noviherbaspirillum sp.]HZW21102.1 flavin monoamine oxidase family protein [Noviherbaspirillum sp.]